MHNNYSINIACLCEKNFTKSLEEVKSFFSFKMSILNLNSEKHKQSDFDAILVDHEMLNKIPENLLSLPKILINKKKKTNTKAEIIFKLPLNIYKFQKKVVELCKRNEFKKNSLIEIKDYILDKNERTLKKNKKVLKITEKEINFICILNTSKFPLSKKYILENIWLYSSGTETHTIETHIYRLRQKIKETFGDQNFIKNTKDGYSF